MNLDAADKKILGTIIEDARTPITGLAKKTRLSQDAVRNRIRKLEGPVIERYLAVINTKLLGYINYHVLLRTSFENDQQRKVMYTTLCALPHVRTVLEFTGSYDVQIACLSKNIQDIQEQLHTLQNACDTHLNEIQIILVSNTVVSKNAPADLVGIKETTIKVKEKTHKKYTPDATDITLLKEISNNGRAQYYTLAQQLSTTHDTVRYRIQRMREANIISSFVPDINFTELGYTFYSILLRVQNYTQQDILRVETFAQQSKQCLWFATSIGIYNMMLYVLAKDGTQLNEFSHALRSLLGQKLRDFEILVLQSKLKYGYYAGILSK